VYFHILTRSSLILPRESLGNIPIGFFYTVDFSSVSSVFIFPINNFNYLSLVREGPSVAKMLSFRSSAFINDAHLIRIKLYYGSLTHFM
jgi:hypothetical protein